MCFEISHKHFRLYELKQNETVCASKTPGMFFVCSGECKKIFENKDKGIEVGANISGEFASFADLKVGK